MTGENSEHSSVELLLDAAARGDRTAESQLLERYRDKLKRMVTVRMDSRLARRVDASDVVQETMLRAHRRLPDYLHQRPVPFYVWLREMAWNRLIDLHRQHILAQRRSVGREQQWTGFSETSCQMLVERLPSLSTPSQRVMNDEARRRLREALGQLPDRDREVLLLRHLEGMSVEETAAALRCAPGTVKSRHFRALQRLRAALDEGAS